MGTGKKFLVIGGGLIALYLAVSYTTGSGRLIATGSKGASSVIKAFQGRT